MSQVRGAPMHPQTQGKFERWHQTLKNRILLENYFVLGDLEAQIEAFVEHYNAASAFQDPLALAAKEQVAIVRLVGRPIYVAEGPSGERAFSVTSAAVGTRSRTSRFRGMASDWRSLSR